MKAKDMTAVALSAVVIAVCAWINIPMTVPFTLQTLGIFLALRVLGGKKGTLAILVYILLGAVGVPVFSGFKGGVGALLGPTGGYILGFLATGLVYTLLEKLPLGSKGAVFLRMGVGMLCYTVLGTAWFYFTYAAQNSIGFGRVLMLCVVPFLLPDTVKLVLAALLGEKIENALQKIT